VPLAEQTRDAIEQKTDLTICYFDLDNFKPYNDTYGYAKGDHVISLTAETLTQHIVPERDFIGHVGGDDFVILFESPDWAKRCEAILNAFKAHYAKWYSGEHLLQGGIHALDRQGNERFYPMLSLSIGAVSLGDFPELKTEHQLAEFASQAKSMAKKITGNSLYQLNNLNQMTIAKEA
jgi:diguanylate cyclase (GGDEF)-like protein